MKIFTLEQDAPRRKLDRYWEMCVGSCHAATALRRDYQEQLERCQRELGFQYVRFHGLFDDDMSVVTKPMLGGNLKLSFGNIDKIFDFLISINMKPFVEIGFMPEVLASGNKTVFHYKGNTTPPKDYEQWAWLIREFIQHLMDRYGREEVRQWFFEVWNEPNLGGPDSPFGFWSSTKEEYFKLYQVTAEAVKEVDPVLRVGGPATSNNAWIPEFLSYCRENHAPVDFVSTHHYPTDVVLGYGVENSANFSNPLDLSSDEKKSRLMKIAREGGEELEKLKQEYLVFQSTLWEHVERGVLTDMAKQAREEADGLPLYYTEWGSLAGLPSDSSFGASFIPKTILDNLGLVQGYSFWTFSDIFEESGQESAEFFGGFGLLTQHGIAKAPYRAYQLLHQLGTEIYEEGFRDTTVDIYPVAKPESNALQFMMVNHHSLLHPIAEERVRIVLKGHGNCLAADIQRIDGEHANALPVYEKMGSPVYLTQGQIHTLMGASELRRERQEFTQSQGEILLDVVLPPMGTALVTVYFS